MTTSSWTPPTCRSAQLRRLMRRPPFTDRVSIGVVRSNTRLLACGSVIITFSTVHARARAAVGTRRGIYRSQPASHLRAGFFGTLRPTAARDHSCARAPLGNTESLFLRNRVVTIGVEHFVRHATVVVYARFARRSEYWRSTGVVQVAPASWTVCCWALAYPVSVAAPTMVRLAPSVPSPT
jgi:hypothetical protein